MEQIFSTIQDGVWSSPNTWGGIIPPKDSAIEILHNIVLDMNATTCGIMIDEGATLEFDSNKNIILDNCENIEVMGTLRMRPSITSKHTILFHDVNELLFVGGGMDVIDSDTGIWVRHNGVLDIQGSEKVAWCNLLKGVKKGDVTIELTKAPTGWDIGDEISISPTTTTSTSTFATGFDVRIIKSITDNIITLTSGLSYDHPLMVNTFNSEIYGAEVLNLTRNVRIEGKSGGRVHINIGMINNPSIINYVQLRWMGPRKISSDGYTDKVLGRYALHFHFCGDVTKGMVVEGVVARDCGSHGFVAHASNGIEFEDCITYNTYETPYWWDVPPETDWTNPVNNSNNISFCSCVAALIKCDPVFRGYRMAGFQLGSGIGNMLMDCVVVGNQGNAGAAGFLWPESSNYTDNVWNITGRNIAHNNKNDGIFVWQNDNHNHILNGFIIYRNGNHGIEHGAYTNSYKYSNIYLLENKGSGIFIYSLAATNGIPGDYNYNVTFTNIKSTEQLYITQHTLPGKSTLFKDCSFPKVVVSELPKKTTNLSSGLFDFINCKLQKSQFNILGIEPTSIIRVQDDTAFQITNTGIVNIINFLTIKQ